MWFLLALTGHLLNAIVFLTDKAFVQKIYPSPLALAFISGASGVFTLFALPFVSLGGQADAVVASIFSGAVTVGALVLFFIAVRHDEVSRVVPAIGSLTPLWTFLLASVFLGERLDDRSLLGFSLLALGGIIIAFRSFSAIFRRRDFLFFVLEMSVGFLFAVALVSQKYGFDGMNDFSSFLLARAGGFASALPLLFFSSVRDRLRFSELRGDARTGLLYVGSRIFAGISPLVITLAMSFGSATLVNAMQGVQYVFLYILAIFLSRRFPDIFPEEFSRGVAMQKIAALFFISFGLTLLA